LEGVCGPSICWQYESAEDSSEEIAVEEAVLVGEESLTADTAAAAAAIIAESNTREEDRRDRLVAMVEAAGVTVAMAAVAAIVCTAEEAFMCMDLRRGASFSARRLRRASASISSRTFIYNSKS